MHPLISVIVPIYKVEQYLDKCVKSIVDQKYSNLEIILVDDGSPDKCPEICDRWAKNDKRIKVVHKSNGGVSDARNVGLSVATGDYISFIDSDDWIDVFYYKQLVSEINKSPCDIVACKYLKVASIDEFIHTESKEFVEARKIDNYQAMKELLSGDKIWQVIVNKIYKKDIVSNILFEIGKRHEDDMWTYQVVGASNNIAIIDYTGYFYYQRKDSFMCDAYNMKRLDGIEARILRLKYIEVNFPTLKEQAKIDLFSYCIFACQSVMKFMSGGDKKKAKRIIKKYANTYKLSIEEIKLLRGNNRLWVAFANISFFFCCKIRRLLGVGF